MSDTLIALGIASGIIGAAWVLKGQIKLLFTAMAENLKPAPPDQHIKVDFNTQVEIDNKEFNFPTTIDIPIYEMPKRGEKQPKEKSRESYELL